MRIVLSALLLASLATDATAQATKPAVQRSAVAGTRVSLIPPAAFAPSSQFPGYELGSTGVTILVMEMPGAFSETGAAFSDAAALAAQGMVFLDKSGVTVQDRDGLLVHARQTAQGREYLKWILVLGDEKETVLVVAAVPKELEKTYSSALRTSVLTAVWDKVKNVPYTEGLSYAVTENGGIKFAKRVGSSLMYSKSGTIGAGEANDPVFLVAPSVSQVAIGDTEAFSKARVLATVTMSDIELESSNKVKIDELDGYEIVAKAKQRSSGRPVLLYQVVVFDDQTYYQMVGIASTESKATYLPVFTQMANSFRRKKP